MKQLLRYTIAVFFIFLGLSLPSLGQGVTTAALNGTVNDANGEPLPGANVVAVHLPSGTTYGAATRLDGRFNIPNVRIGGPYKITASFVSYNPESVEGVSLSLGQTLSIDFKLSELTATLDEIVVAGISDPVLNSDRTGAATYVQREKIQALPSISRSTADFTRLTPQASGNSFSGRNSLFNNFSLDGSIFNNPFGLDSPVPGGQTNAQPVSLDAVDQVQVTIAPFDVTQGGFTGAGINTVTKSGTNEFSGSVYFFTRSENLIGDEVKGQSVTNPPLDFTQTGIRLGGPIIKNKLFFFVNAELERRDDPATTFLARRSGESVGGGISRVDAQTMDLIRQRMADVYNYDTGAFEDFIHASDNDKILVKIDWNINQNHSLSVRYNFLDAERDLPPNPFAISFNNSGRGPNQNSLPFQNAGYTINNEINSIVGELNSRFGNKFSNKLLIGFTAFRDFRTPFSEPFPTIEIGQDGTTFTTLGHEPFSINNVLDQDVWQFTNNFNWYEGKHVFTIGTNLEVFKFNNSFNLFRFGLFPAPGDLDLDGDGIFDGFNDLDGDGDLEPLGTTYSSVENFLEATDPNSPNFRDFRAEIAQFEQAPLNLAETDVGQWGFYIQDEFQVNPQLKITTGLRIDVPLYFSDIPRNNALAQVEFRDEDFNPERIDNSKFPDARILWSPRIGFNWDVKGDRSTQLRGGTGIFTGRLPFVWLGNQTANQGFDDINNIGTINVSVDDFRWPQVWKNNLAVDQKLPFDMIGTIEFIYGKDINAVFVRNANLGPEINADIAGPDDRPLFGGTGLDPNVTGPLLNPNVGGAFVLDNTDKGYHYSITTQLRKDFREGIVSGLSTMLAYTFSESKDVMTSTEIAQFLFEGNAISGNPNRPDLEHSAFGLRHRFIGSLNYRKEYAKNFGTSVGLFFEAARGGRFSYTYAGDVNGDGVGGNDLIFIPRNASEITFVQRADGLTPEQQWQAFNQFIEQDDYLSDNRGSIADRNGALGEWFTTIDLKIAQDFFINVGGKRNTLQLSLDILNLGNFVNSDWGVRQTPISRNPLQFEGYQGNTPTFTFVGNQDTFANDTSLLSRWQMQFGVRYMFN